MADQHPAFFFYPGDWVQDTRCLTLATKGAWIDLLCAMWRSQTRGTLTLPLQGYARLISASPEQTAAIIKELTDMQVCNSVTNGDGSVTLSNRRMVREQEARSVNRLRTAKWRNKTRDSAGDGSVTQSCREVMRHQAVTKNEKKKSPQYPLLEEKQEISTPPPPSQPELRLSAEPRPPKLAKKKARAEAKQNENYDPSWGQEAWPSARKWAWLYNEHIPKAWGALRMLDAERAAVITRRIIELPCEDDWTKIFLGVGQQRFLVGPAGPDSLKEANRNPDWLLQNGKDGRPNYLKVFEGRFL